MGVRTGARKRHDGSEVEEDGMLPVRVCATPGCGKRTRNYRCDACWIRIKAESTSCDEPIAEYSFGRR